MKLKGILTIPASKSYMQRAAAAALLSKGNTKIYNYGISKDDKASLEIIQSLGAEIIEQTEEYISIQSNGFNPNSNEINANESGFSSRLFSIICSLHHEPITINGKGSLLTRPIDWLIKNLPQTGVEIELLNKNFFPITIKGTIKAGNYTFDGSVSSQYISGLLMTLPLVNGDSILTIKNPVSNPYIQMTLDLLKAFGIEIEHENYSTYNIKGNQEYKACDYVVESDWSSAAFWICGAAINGNLTLKGLNPNSVQADKLVLEAIKKAGGNYSFDNNDLHIQSSELNGFEIDLTNAPDLFPVLSVLAMNSEGTSCLHGIHRLKHKESDRTNSILTELKKCNVDIYTKNDSLIINGIKNLNFDVEFNVHNDHRIAMAMSLVSLMNQKATTILGHECVSKSYPDFFKHFEQLSEKININE